MPKHMSGNIASSSDCDGCELGVRVGIATRRETTIGYVVVLLVVVVVVATVVGVAVPDGGVEGVGVDN